MVNLHIKQRTLERLRMHHVHTVFSGTGSWRDPHAIHAQGVDEVVYDPITIPDWRSVIDRDFGTPDPLVVAPAYDQPIEFEDGVSWSSLVCVLGIIISVITAAWILTGIFVRK